MWTAIFVPAWHFTGEVVVLHKNVAFVINYGCLLICAIGVGYQAHVTLGRGGSDACSGRYMASKWTADESPVYKALATTMGVYLLIAIILTLIGFGVETKVEELMDFLFYKISPVILITANAFALAHHHVPDFDYDNEEFRSLRFHRDWVDLLLQPSYVFMAKFESALLHARGGNKRQLMEMLEFEDDVDMVLKCCTFEEDDEEPGTMEVKIKDHVMELLG
eukprot:CAMPEP_0197664060 /NCGR_PEP_ID=MMETSP1338-20131121/58408_1 /TAXON_ID=43686 ORGANISM="Pelagodinium beii, Strain RCC1491" /NCGR_SAMPLE_ID=MMETSP1338 /ASSEMBLY_ACC=CAM_ASM_000754 /LENGTH=220 /DNA_ID=CAMNT_0043242623 /DNA_START=238 /DNA_END=900 /DNA_ORIENTATION=-